MAPESGLSLDAGKFLTPLASDVHIHETVLYHVTHLETLGSHLSANGKLAEDLRLHMESRYKSCIKFYNFLRENKFAPLVMKLKVLRACVVNSQLYNCETFGHLIPNDLEKTYDKLLRRTLNLRTNTPALTSSM